MYVDQFPLKRLGVCVNVFENKLKIVQLRNHKKKYADVSYDGLLKKKIESIFNKLSENIYLLGLAYIVCTQFQLERKPQF